VNAITRHGLATPFFPLEFTDEKNIMFFFYKKISLRMLLSVLLFLFAVLYILKVSVHLSEWSFFFASDYIQREQLSCVYKVLETFF